VIEPRLRGEAVALPELTFAELAERFLERHGSVRSPRTVRTLRERLARPLEAFGDVPLLELERMGGDLADFAATLPPRFRYAVMGAVRQTLGAGVRWCYLSVNPALAGPNPEPPPRDIRAYSPAELAALEEELDPAYAPIVPFAAATGLRPSEWAALQRPQVDRQRRLLQVPGTKTTGSRREVPLTRVALDALDRVPARLGSRLLFKSPSGVPLDLDNFHRRVWAPAVEASGIETPARLYDLRSTFASNALARGLTVHELARVMGTSGRMIERHYGTLLDGAQAAILARLDRPEEGSVESFGP
jgi:integrase